MVGPPWGDSLGGRRLLVNAATVACAREVTGWPVRTERRISRNTGERETLEILPVSS
jgi:hypothetical protein